MIVISDASPIMNLAAIGLLNLLPALFESVVIPAEVHYEITALGKGKPGSDAPETEEGLIVKECQNLDLVKQLKKQLDPGESEAITLALELGADLLLIDENIGRAVAQTYHLKIIGLLGLVSAKNKGLIPNVKTPMENLINQARFFIGTDLRKEVLKMAGESD